MSGRITHLATCRQHVKCNSRQVGAPDAARGEVGIGASLQILVMAGGSVSPGKDGEDLDGASTPIWTPARPSTRDDQKISNHVGVAPRHSGYRHAQRLIDAFPGELGGPPDRCWETPLELI